MSVSRWAYTPAKCDGHYCPGECDLCSLREVDNESGSEDSI